MEKRDNVEERMGNASREREILRKNLTEMLVRNTARNERCL